MAAPPQSHDLPVLGMTCANCAANIERTLTKKVKGVSRAQVNLALESLSLDFDPDVTSLETIAGSLESIGFRLLIPEKGEDLGDAERREREAETSRQVRALSVGLVFTLPLFLLSMSRDFHLLGPWAHAPWVGWLFFCLATPVQFYTGFGFYTGAARSLFNRSANMDVLVSLGATTAYVYSLAVLLGSGLGDHVYFETSAVIITLIRLGKFLEARARGRASGAIRNLMDRAPKTARLVGEEGKETLAPVSAVHVEDVLRVKPGEQVPVDGEVLSGRAAVDESMMTGESVPSDKTAGEKVYGGTLNLDGVFTFRATAVGAETAIARIIELVRRAQGSKAPMQRLADRAAAVFVPAVLGVAAVTFALWMVAGPGFVPAMVRCVAVLVIACPCALGLATPTAIAVGAGRGASMGILFRNNEALETMNRTTTVFFDKTGTLTVGRPRLAEWVPLGEEEASALGLAASAEGGSEHPLAQAVVQGALDRGFSLLPIEDFRSWTGDGVEARVGEQRVRVGRVEWVSPNPPPVWREEVLRLSGHGGSILAVAVDGNPAGLMAVTDRERAGAKDAVARLKGLGLRPVMVTGDRLEAAKAVAERVGLLEVNAGVRPEGKEILVREAQDRGEVVAVVGDGINDAPALARADVGIAVGSGSDVAMESADVTLVGGDLSQVARAVRLSRATVSVVRQNLFWAFFYNVALVPVAAGILYPLAWMPDFLRELHPILAAAAMAASSVTVVLNSLRLSRVDLGVPLPSPKGPGYNAPSPTPSIGDDPHG